METIKEKEVYTLKELADFFKVTVQAVHKWVDSGKIKVITTPGGTNRITKEEWQRVTR